MSRMICTVVASLAGALLTGGAASARDQIQISGSSTVLPYAKIVAETFGEVYPEYKIPVIESGGSGAGIKEFCRGIGDNTIDITNASRPIKPAELQLCFDAGVRDVQQVRIGYDGIVFATDMRSPDWNLSARDIYRALAARVVIGGRLEPNPVKTWNEVNPSLPAWDIAAYIPGEKHGTREVFEEKLMLAGCRESGAFAVMKMAGMNDRAADAACIAVRKDGRAIDIDGDYSETLARIASNKTGIGVFGLAFYENNADRLKVAAVDDVIPSEQTIASGRYAVSRPLYFYVKKAHIGVIPGLKEYVDFFLSDQMIGPDGPLAEYGLVAAPEAERRAQRAAFDAGKTMALQ